MQIAIASGKGGTGKTTVATNLALVASQSTEKKSTTSNLQLLDCDVEEPNCHIFFDLQDKTEETVHVPVPDPIEELCTGCGQCADICEYNAIACLGKRVLPFPELCHGCGGCWLICPENAIKQTTRSIGTLERASLDGIDFIHGHLRIGEAMAPPLIKAIKEHIDPGKTVIIDAPPGTSCPVVEAISGADFVCLVTEPTPFGLNDLALACELVDTLSIPMGVVINRSDIGDDRAKRFCEEKGIPLLAEIPNNRALAEAYSNGRIAGNIDKSLRSSFETLWSTIVKQLETATAGKGPQ